MLCFNVDVCLSVTVCVFLPISVGVRVGIESFEYQIDELFVVLNWKLQGYFHSTFGDKFCFACFIRIQSDITKIIIVLFYTGIGHMFAL